MCDGACFVARFENFLIARCFFEFRGSAAHGLQLYNCKRVNKFNFWGHAPLLGGTLSRWGEKREGESSSSSEVDALLETF